MTADELLAAQRLVRRLPVGESVRSEEHTSELQSLTNLVCRLLLEKKKKREINKHDEAIERLEVEQRAPGATPGRFTGSEDAAHANLSGVCRADETIQLTPATKKHN